MPAGKAWRPWCPGHQAELQILPKWCRVWGIPKRFDQEREKRSTLFYKDSDSNTSVLVDSFTSQTRGWANKGWRIKCGPQLISIKKKWNIDSPIHLYKINGPFYTLIFCRLGVCDRDLMA